MKNIFKSVLSNTIVFVILCCFVILACNFATKKEAEKISVQLQEAFDDVDREQALMQLSELRGRITEMKYLYFSDFSDSAKTEVAKQLENELEDIVFFQNSDNPYLKEISVSPNSYAGAICDEILSQINDQIHTIRYGSKGD